jgi:hypothetical protein
MITIPLVVCIIGFLVWFVNSRLSNPDAVIGEAGRILFFAGALVTLWNIGNRSLL